MTAIPAPNYTQTPNVIFENMANMGNAELRIVLAVVRKTFGWHKAADRLSISQIIGLTGLSRQGALDGIAAAMKNGWLDRKKCKNSFEYSLVIDGQASRPESVKPVDQLPVYLVDTQKKEVNKEKETITRSRGENFHPIAETLAKVCKMDLSANRGVLFREAKLLSRAIPPPTPELINQHYNGDPLAFWKVSDWRGQKGQTPTPAQVRETWGQWTQENLNDRNKKGARQVAGNEVGDWQRQQARSLAGSDVPLSEIQDSD